MCRQLDALGYRIVRYCPSRIRETRNEITGPSGNQVYIAPFLDILPARNRFKEDGLSDFISRQGRPKG
jgi:hypothetical protein